MTTAIVKTADLRSLQSDSSPQGDTVAAFPGQEEKQHDGGGRAFNLTSEVIFNLPNSVVCWGSEGVKEKRGGFSGRQRRHLSEQRVV